MAEICFGPAVVWPGARRTPEDRAKVSLLLDHAPGLAGQSVPDPYYGGSRGFDEVLDLCERGCAGLLDAIRERFAI